MAPAYLAAALVLSAILAAAISHAQWAPQGTPVCTSSGHRGAATLTPDGAGGVFVTWVDGRRPQLGRTYAQRVSAGGQIHWMLNGLAICDSCNADLSFAQRPACIPDGSEGMIAAWVRYSHAVWGYDIEAARIDGSGVSQWNPVVLSTHWYWPFGVWTIPKGQGGAIVGWSWQQPPDGPINVSTSGVSMDGEVLWFDRSLTLGNDVETGSVAVSDGAGGAFVAWMNLGYSFRQPADIFSNRIDHDGVRQWGLDAQVSFGPDNDTELRATTDGQGGAWLVWRGNRQWDRVFAVRIDGSGKLTPHADGAFVTTTGSPQMSPAVAADGEGGAIFAWEDHRGADADIYAQRFNETAHMQWAEAGVPICSATGAQSAPVMVPDGSGGAIIAWTDRRSASSDIDIYAQRVDAGGEALWAADGVPVCTAPGRQHELDVLPDGRGGAFIVWTDQQSGSHIYLQRVTAQGIVGPVAAVDEVRPQVFGLSPPRPNPMSSATRFVLELSIPQPVSIEIFSVNGRLIRRLASGETFPAGQTGIAWDGRNDSGPVPPGLYLMRVGVGIESATRRIVVLR